MGKKLVQFYMSINSFYLILSSLFDFDFFLFGFHLNEACLVIEE